MTDEEPQNFAEERPAFPYEVLWSGYGNAKVTLRELASNAGEYRALNELAALPHYSAPYVTEEAIAAVLSELGVHDRFAEPAWLICAYYLAPRQAAKFNIDPKTSRKVLMQAAHAARLLERALDRLSPKVLAALFYIRPTIEGVRDPKGPPFHELHDEVADFAKVATEVAGDLRGAEGRPRYHERDSMIRLLIELCADAGLNDLKSSNGTKANPEPHLKGKAGRLIVELIKLVEPSWEESWIAPRVKAVRAQMRGAAKTGAKNRRA